MLLRYVNIALVKNFFFFRRGGKIKKIIFRVGSVSSFAILALCELQMCVLVGMVK
jgi:hypothetical protein